MISYQLSDQRGQPVGNQKGSRSILCKQWNSVEGQPRGGSVTTTDRSLIAHVRIPHSSLLATLDEIGSRTFPRTDDDWHRTCSLLTLVPTPDPEHSTPNRIPPPHIALRLDRSRARGRQSCATSWGMANPRMRCYLVG